MKVHKKNLMEEWKKKKLKKKKMQWKHLQDTIPILNSIKEITYFHGNILYSFCRRSNDIQFLRFFIVCSMHLQ